MRPVCAALAGVALAVTGCIGQSGRDNLSYGSGSETGSREMNGGASTGLRSPLSIADFSFINQAGFGGVAEVQASQMAETRASSPAVMKFARMMIADHTRANEELAELARQLGLAAPSGPDTGRQQAARMLSNLSGAKFDQEYIALQVAEHRVAVALFQAEASGGQEAAIRNFATRYEPTLRQHLRQAEQLSEHMVSAVR
jgi:putative membrane protein